MDSSALPKWQTEFLSEWIINRVNEYFTLVMEPFNSPNRGNDILSRGCYLKRGGELFNVVNWASILQHILGCSSVYCSLFESVLIKTPSTYALSWKHTFSFHVLWPGCVNTLKWNADPIWRMGAAWSRTAKGDFHSTHELTGVINITLICPRKDLS